MISIFWILVLKEREENQIGSKASGTRSPGEAVQRAVVPRQSLGTLRPCSAGARPGDLFVLESEVLHSRCSDHEETRRVFAVGCVLRREASLSASGPWPAHAGDGQRWLGGSAWLHDRPGVDIDPEAGASHRGVSLVWHSF